MSQKLINGLLGLGLVAALLVGGLAIGSHQGASPKRVGGLLVTFFENGVRWTTQGLYVGLTAQFQVDSSGNVTTSGSVTSTGATSTINSVSDVVYRAPSMTAATTTPCALGPVLSTSTIESLVANITAGTTTASTLTWATSTTPFATTSVIAQKSVAAGAQSTFDWHPAKDNSLIFPNTYVVLGQQGGIGTFSNTGACNMVTRSVN
jgi:hypothetical protein